MNGYEIYEFTYIDRSSRCKFVVYARTLKVANNKIDNLRLVNGNYIKLSDED